MTTQPVRNVLKVANPPLEGNVRTYLTSDVATNDTTLPALSTTGFPGTSDVDYYGILGDYGQEKTEIKLIDTSATTVSQFTIAGVSYSHSSSDPITKIDYNQIRIYGATTSGGTKNLVATFDIDTTQQYTEYIDTTGTYGFFYSVYYNSYLDTISAYSEEIVSTSFSRLSAKRIIKSGLRKALTYVDESPNSVLNWDIALEILQDGVDEIMLKKKNWIFLHKIDTSTTTTSGQAYIDQPSDISILEHLIVDDCKLDWISRLDYDGYTEAGTTVSTGSPTYYTMKNNKFYLYPTPDSDYDVKYEYFKYPAEITTLNTDIDTEFASILIYYCAAHFAWIRGNDKRGDKNYALYSKLLEDQYIEYSGPNQLGDAEYVERTNEINKEYLI